MTFLQLGFALCLVASGARAACTGPAGYPFNCEPGIDNLGASDVLGGGHIAPNKSVQFTGAQIAAGVNAMLGGPFLPLAGGSLAGGTVNGGTFTAGTISGATITGSTVAGYLALTGGALSGATITGSTIAGYLPLSAGVGSPLSGALVIGAPPQNALTITPGAASTNLITFGQSGTGNYSFGTGQVSASSFYGNAGGANGGTFTYSTAQTNLQNGLLVVTNTAGSLTGTNTFAANQITIPGDTTSIPHTAQGGTWFKVSGNYGLVPWAQNTAVGLNVQRAANGNVYIVTTAGTTSNSGTGPSGTGTGITDGTAVWNYVSLNGSGNRAGFASLLGVRSLIGAASGGTTIDQQWSAMINTTTISANQGGAAGAGASRGTIYGDATQAWCQSGATFLNSCVSHEFDVGVFTGASSANRFGINIVSYGNIQAYEQDIGLRFGQATSAPGWHVMIAAGIGSFDTTGSVFSYVPVTQGNLIAPGLTYANPIVALGFDLSGVDATTAAFRSSGGFRVGPSGSIATGPFLLSSASTAVSLDTPGNLLTGISGVTAGTDYKAGDEVYDAATGSVVTINTVNGSGTPATWTITRAGGTSGAAPSNPMAFAGGTGINLAFTATWTQVSTLQLQPSGGNTVVGTGSALSTSATSGFLQIATMAGSPSGNCGGAAGKACLVVDTSGKKICYNVSGTTWECTVALTP